ncbi:Dscam [Cordylochernes scorpioides]|uniref:Dscam n=1 Tax=Cordylochernes scorpioides TaxID=51811 RepID=A0ABY6JZT3_9ARAC|nr:Dscam [Cordylochernes scorpioides]
MFPGASIIEPFTFQKPGRIGERTAAMCFVSAAAKDVSFQWLKDGQPIKDETIDISSTQVLSTLSLLSVEGRHRGNYTCRVESSLGRDTYTASLSVEAPPQWIGETPTRLEVKKGQPLEVPCQASGSPDPKITWTQHSEILGERLQIPAVLESDAGVYTCTADNGIKPALSRSVDVRVLEAAIIEPFNFQRPGRLGERTAAICIVSSAAKEVSFTWLKDGQPIEKDESTDITSSYGASTLYLHSVEQRHEGNYTCRVETSLGVDTYTTTLRVEAPPRWTVESPSRVEAKLGQPLHVPCQATGSPTPRISWKKHDQDLGERLDIPTVQESDAGTYICIASNGLEPSLSRMIEVIILDCGLIEPFTFQKAGRVGDRTSATCLVSGSAKEARFTWLKDGQPLRNDDTTDITSSKGASYLTLQSLEPSHQGNYTCRVETSLGKDSYTAVLKVEAPPSWELKPPNKMAIKKGQPLTIPCQARGSPEPKITWRKYQKDLGEHLEFSAILETDAGIYECIASNGLQPDLIELVDISVLGSVFLVGFLGLWILLGEIHCLGIIEPFRFQKPGRLGERTAATCLASSTTRDARFRWLKDGQELRGDGNVEITHTTGASFLTLQSVEQRHQGNYTCLVDSSAGGSDSFTAVLVVEAPPSWIDEPPPTAKILLGQPLRIPCQATGSPVPRIIWSRSQQEIGEHLDIPAVQMSDAGMYQCTADNGLQPSLSSILQVHILGANIIEPFTFQKPGRLGQRTAAICLVSATTEDVRFTWLKDGQPLQQTEDVLVTNSVGTSLLTLQNIKSSSEGNYTCQVETSRGMESHTALLRVEAPPQWVTKPPSRVGVKKGQRLNVPCQATGSPIPKISWTKSHQNLGESFDISVAKEDHAGIYHCTADNGLEPSISYTIEASSGCDMTSFGNLWIFLTSRSFGILHFLWIVSIFSFIESSLISPFIFQKPGKLGKSTAAICFLSSPVQNAKFIWFKDGKVLEESENIEISQSKMGSTLFLHSVEQHHQGNYTCRVESSLGVDAHTAVLNVEAPPQWIIEPPARLEVKKGSRLHVPCQATGSPVPRVTWTQSDQDLGDRLDLPSVTDSGVYRCMASNGLEPGLSKLVEVLVLESSLISPFTFQKPGRLGKSTAATCLLSSPVKNAQFIWLKDGKVLEETETVEISQSRVSSTLSLHSVEQHHQGNYTCRVESSLGVDAHTAVLHVEAPPQWIIEPPARLEVKKGSRLHVPCQATGSPVPRVTWTQSGQDLGDHLDLPSVTDSGVYRCSVSNGLEPGLSKLVEVLVLDAAIIEPFTFHRPGRIGERTAATCLVSAAVKEARFTWLKDGHILENSENIHINTHQGLSVLSLQSVEQEHQGNYTCRVETSMGVDSFTTTLRVEAPPRWILEPPSTMEIRKGAKLSVPCIATGSPDPKVSWSKSLQDIGERLEIPSVQESDAGIYQCTADNGLQPSLSKSTNVVILVTTSAKDPIFAWFKDDVLIANDDDRYIFTHQKGFSVLSIDPVEQVHQGNYTCQVQTSIGTERFTAYLRVEAPPKWIEEPPPKVHIKKGQSLKIPCSAMGSPDPKISWSRSQQDLGDRLDFSAVQESDAGLYHCTADNGLEPSISRSVELNVLECRLIEPFSFQMPGRLGRRTIASCVVSSSPTDVKFYWSKDGQPIEKDGNIDIAIHEGFSVLSLKSVEQHHQGNYTCTVETDTARDSFTVFLRVEAPPHWVEEPPARVEVKKGGRLAVPCQATGSPAPKISWRKNEQEIGERLELPAVQESDAGTYRCSADNGLEPSIHRTLEIHVLDFHVIQPFSFQSPGRLGERTAATCVVTTSEDSVDFRWTKDGKSLEQDGNIAIINHEGVSLLTIKAVETVHQGNYTCHATSGLRQEAFTVFLKVEAPPHWIVKPPNKLEIKKGQKLKIHCEASGNPSPKVTWTRSLQDLGSNLEIVSVQESNAGTYTCTADNGVGPSISHTVEVQVLELRLIEPFTFHKTGKIGDKTSATCVSTKLAKDAKFSWFKDGQPLKTDSNININNEKGFSFLFILSVEQQHEGNYTCEVQAVQGTDRYSAFLRVEAPPQWTSEPPARIEIKKGQRLTIPCQASGSPIPKISWAKSHQDLGDHLEISEVQISDSGVYQCSADNGIEPNLSRNVEVHVLVRIGERTSATCVASASVTNAKFIWLKDGQPVEADGKINFNNEEGFSFLFIKSVEQGHQGNYTCEIQASQGSDSYTVFLRVEAPPKWIEAPPARVEVRKGNRLTVPCQASGSPPPKISWRKSQHEIGDHLEVSSVQDQDAGVYICTADNGLEPSISSTVEVIVQEASLVLPFTFQAPGRVGERNGAMCVARANVSGAHFTWTKDGKPLSEDLVSISSQDGFSFLAIQAVSPEHEGNYTCTISSSQGSDSHTAFLRVEAPPKWEEMPPDRVNIKKGTSLHVPCKASGSPTPRILWTKSNKELGDHLTIPAVQETDAGIYRCSAENGLEPSLSRAVAVNVLGKERIDKSISSTACNVYKT